MGDIAVSYEETESVRRLRFDRDGATAVLEQNIDGYAMVTVRTGVDAPVLERYYGFDMALDHAAELLDTSPAALSVPEAAADMGM